MSTAQYQPSPAAARPADGVGAVTGPLGPEDDQAGSDTDRVSVRLAPVWWAPSSSTQTVS